jgi:hypothetical protein
MMIVAPLYRRQATVCAGTWIKFARSRHVEDSSVGKTIAFKENNIRARSSPLAVPAGARVSTREIFMKMRSAISTVVVLVLAQMSWEARATEPPLPKTGSAKLGAYATCRSLASVDMGPLGSQSSAECVGIVTNKDSSTTLNNLAIQCLEEARTRADGYSFTGTCAQTDADGDKLFMTYEGPESGPVVLIGGTGKYKDIEGGGSWTVTDAPGNTSTQFSFTLNYAVEWRFK